MRYVKEVRWRFVGDTQACQRYLGIARTILGEVYNQDIEVGGNEQAWRQARLADGTEINVQISGSVPFITIKVPYEPETETEPVADILRLRWEPEGILLTPTTLAEPDGWGLPSRAVDESGLKLIEATPSGSLPQVLLNRYRNNKYHDEPQWLTGLPESFEGLFPEEYIPPITRDEYDTGWIVVDAVEPIVAHRARQQVSFSEPSEEGENGDYILGPLYETGAALSGPPLTFVIPQTDIVEPKTEEWHAHRPEEVLYPTLAHEWAFQETNTLRLNVGEARLHRPLRGESAIGDIAASNMQVGPGEVYAHSYYGWRPGFRTAVGRTHLCTGQSMYGFSNNNTNENVQGYTALPAGVDTPEELGAYLIGEWAASPGHYAAMISNAWSERTVYPWHPWVGQGHKGAQMHLGASEGVAVSYSWDINLGDYGYELTELPEALSITAWNQVFVARETWLPIYAEVRTHTLGTSGRMGPTNPYGRDYYTTIRKFAVESSIYELPEGNEPPTFDAFGDMEDDFMTCLGSAPFARDGRIFIRGVYWKSSTQLRGDAAVEAGDGYGELVVVVWPDGLGESPILPWREDEQPEAYMVEHRQRFLELDGWVSECEGSVKFNQAGTQFLIELERVGADTIFEGISRWERINNQNQIPFDRVPGPDDFTFPFFSGQGLFNIQRIPMLYDATFSNDDPLSFEELLPDRTPLEVSCDAGYAEDNYKHFFYETRIDGDYAIWPHFVVDGEGVESIAYITLRIDEHWYQYDSDVNDPTNEYDPRAPAMTDGTSCWGYRHHRLIFPSGKEITYMQQYMVHGFAAEFPNTVPPGFDRFPGTGDNFYAVIHYLDVENEHIIYSTHGTVTYNKYWSTDPLGNAVPIDAGKDTNPVDYSWTRGDSYYYLDVFTGSDRVQEVLAEYPGSLDNRLMYQSMTEQHSAGKAIQVVHGYDLYNPGHTPYTGPNVANITFGGAYSRAVITMQMVPGPVFSDVSYYRYSGAGPENDGRDGIFCFHDSMPVNDYNATVSTRQSDRGEDRTISKLDEAGHVYRGEQLSGAYHNVAPMFSRDSEVRAKFVEYDGRWIARLEVRHINRYGLHKPENSLRSGYNAFVPGDFSMNTPYDSQANPEYMNSLVGTRWESALFTAYDTDTAVHLKANFDIDAAVGISDVYDIEPFGRVG